MRSAGSAEEPNIDSNGQWRADEQALAQVRRFNKVLAWLPRFHIRNRVGPWLIQTLLRIAQLLGLDKLARYGLSAETRRVGVDDASVPVRIIRPRGEARGVVLDFHGGGWVIGNARMDDAFNARLVDACDVTVVSVDYRLATSATLEEILADCLAAARWLLDERREFAHLPVVIVGESAGAHLAAATLLGLKAWPDRLARVSGAVLYYGLYDLAGTASVRSAEPHTLVLDGPGMLDALRMLTPGLSDEQRRQPPHSPLYGDFAHLPPALMFAGELDPLRDDTVELAQRWAESAEVEVHLLPDSPHGFIHFPTVMADRVLACAHDWIANRIDASTERVANPLGE